MYSRALKVVIIVEFQLHKYVASVCVRICMYVHMYMLCKFYIIMTITYTTYVYTYILSLEVDFYMCTVITCLSSDRCLYLRSIDKFTF